MAGDCWLERQVVGQTFPDPRRLEAPMSRFASVMSHVAEMTVFFAAAAALGAGLLHLK